MAMDEARFWSMIEAAWARVPKAILAERRALAERDPDERGEVSSDLEGALDGVLERLRVALDALPADELLAFDRILERKLYAIDRAEIQEVTDGSDDGFLYCRGWIVAMGQMFYENVDAEPRIAICDAEHEAICYLSWHLYEQKFGKAPRGEVSRETGSNQAGWA